MDLGLYSVFHLNLNFSSVEEEQRSEVIHRSYWPLLRLAERLSCPLGIELTGNTLETIARLDPDWIEALHDLLQTGKVELIGSGYAQIIGPLVPWEVTAANQRIGIRRYEDLLGRRPTLALVNEQAFAGGLIPLYLDAGYQAILMEWNNPARAHPEWDTECRYLPQQVEGPEGERLPLIWNQSIAFQKFQRYAHGELELEELLDYLRAHRSKTPRALALYGNDAEIFDFRPGRFMTEEPMHPAGEWLRIERLYQALLSEPGMDIIHPSSALELRGVSGANQCLQLGSAAQPIPVKKQEKYNLVRWAVTGRDDLGINTRCWRVFESMRQSGNALEDDWKELCYLWGSDFRTHITERRWAGYLDRLQDLEARWGRTGKPRQQSAEGDAFSPTVPVENRSAILRPGLSVGRGPVRVERAGRFLTLQGKRLEARFNLRRGLALDAFTDLAYGSGPLCGTLAHGHFDDIRFGADFYSGHVTLESPGEAKVTDLCGVEPELIRTDAGVRLQCEIQTPQGLIRKSWSLDDQAGILRLALRFQWPTPLVGSLRLGYVTLFPDAFELQDLHYATHNGGRGLEVFSLHGTDFSHGQAVSFLVSASHALGVTDGLVQLGDGRRRLEIRLDKSMSAMIGMMSHHVVDRSSFTRLCFSARELDDTSRPAPVGDLEVALELRCTA